MGEKIFFETDRVEISGLRRNPGRFPDLMRSFESRESRRFLIWWILAAAILVSLLATPAMAILPTADFTMNPQSGMGRVPLTVYFTDTSTGSLGEWQWDFGDGRTSYEQNPVHQYQNPGIYTVSLTVYTPLPKGSVMLNPSEMTRTIIAYEPTLALSPSSGKAGTQVTVTGSSFNVYSANELISPVKYSVSYIPQATISFNGIVVASNVPITGGEILGSFTTVFTVPAGTIPGSYTVRAVGPVDSVEATFTVTNIPPDAQIDASPHSGSGPLLVRFDGTRSSDPDGSIISYRWDFGDDTTATGAMVDHTYTQPDDYRATLTVTDNQSAARSAYVTITVTNIPPDAQIDATPVSGPGPLLVRFDGTRSSDPDGSITVYKWDFDDNTQASGATADHTYTRPDQYRAILTVTDNQSATDTAYIFIDVDNSPPVAVADARPKSGSDPLTVTFDGSRSYDPDGTIRSYHWDFDDGNGEETTSVSHVYRNPGTYQAILIVTDDKGMTGQNVVEITVGNEVPVARIMVSPQEGSAPLQVSFDGSLSSDKDDNNLTFSWDFGDGSRAETSIATHEYRNQGTHRVSLQVADPHGAIGNASATVKVVQPFPWWYVVIGGLGAGIVVEEIIRNRSNVVGPGETLPEKCKYPESPVQIDVRSGVECKPGTVRELPDISVEIRSGIWKEDEKR